MLALSTTKVWHSLTMGFKMLISWHWHFISSTSVDFDPTEAELRLYVLYCSRVAGINQVIVVIAKVWIWGSYFQDGCLMIMSFEIRFNSSVHEGCHSAYSLHWSMVGKANVISTNLYFMIISFTNLRFIY